MMLPRLQAEEQLMAINAASLGSGMVDQKDAQRERARLEQLAGMAAKRPVRATPGMLAAAGIAVVELPPAQAETASDV